MLTKKVILESCEKHGLYRTPHLNDRLYLHFKGLTELGDVLDEYTEVKVIWLEGNCLTTVKSLKSLTKVSSLYLHQNMLSSIEGGLDHMKNLHNLNLSDNFFKVIEDFSALTNLGTLQLKNNKLKLYEDLVNISRFPPNLSVLDLGHNEIEDPAVVDLLAGMPSLSCLYLHNNPVCSKITPYRKTVVFRCQKLRYLDDRPVFDDERRLVNAWGARGAEGEKEERALMRAEEVATRERHMREFQEMISKKNDGESSKGAAAEGDSDDRFDSDDEVESVRQKKCVSLPTHNELDASSGSTPNMVTESMIEIPSVHHPQHSKFYQHNYGAVQKNKEEEHKTIEKHVDPVETKVDDFWTPS